MRLPAGQSDQTGHRAHDGCCSVCSVLHTGAPVDTPQTAARHQLRPPAAAWSGTTFTPDRFGSRAGSPRKRARHRPFPDLRTSERSVRPRLCRLVQFNKPATEPVSGISDVSSSRALGGRCAQALLASAAVLASVPAVAQTSPQRSLPPVTVDAPQQQRATATRAPQRTATRAARASRVRNPRLRQPRQSQANWRGGPR